MLKFLILMKTSFYFVIWIIIYPLLGLLDSPWIDRNAFIVALIAVWGLSWFLNRAMPDTIRYETLSSRAAIMEEVYTGNIEALRKRLSREATLQFIAAIYFGATFVFVVYSLIFNSDADDWIALALFGLFALGAISGASKYNKAKWQITNDPSPEKCSEVLATLYGMNYDAYYNQRSGSKYEDMLPPTPAHYNAFQIFSLVVAIVCTLLGVVYMIRAILILVMNQSAGGMSAGIMYILYSSLAIYYGIRDTISISQFFRRKKSV